MIAEITTPVTDNLKGDIDAVATKLRGVALDLGFDLLDPKRDNTYAVAKAGLEFFEKTETEIRAKYLLVRENMKVKYAGRGPEMKGARK